MKIPNELKIGGHIFRIKLSTGLNSTEDSGITNVPKSLIAINNSSEVSQSQIESTLIHEIIEAINSLYELDLNHKQISTLESTLYQVLSDNDILK